jgi:MYXO-CTERM domain-containing protein
MGALYTELQGLGQSPERSQKDWLKNQRNPCDDSDCLRAVYAERIRYFESLTSSDAVAGEVATPPTAKAPAVKPPSSAPKKSAPPSFTTSEPTPAATEEPATALATPPGAELIPTIQTPDSQTGIPELPQPEVSFPYPASHQSRPDQSPASSISGEPLVLMGAAVLAIAVGLFAWRRRARIRTALVSDRARLVPFTRRWRTRLGDWTKGLQQQRAKTSAHFPHRAPAMSHTQSSHFDTLHLPVDTLTRLQALALPGESLSSVVTRAVAALESAPETPPSAVLSRLQTLEARLAHLESAGTAKGFDPSGRNPDLDHRSGRP